MKKLFGLIPLVAIGAGVYGMWGWQVSCMVVGGLLWIDLYIPDRAKQQ